MDDLDRQTIRDHLTDLVQFTNYRELADRCVDQGLLFEEMIKKIEVSAPSQGRKPTRMTNRNVFFVPTQQTFDTQTHRKTN